MSSFLTYKNVKIHFSDEGKGNVVLLLHGFLEHLEMWKSLTPYLIKTHRVICVDLLGHGKSECLEYLHTMEDMADAVHTVLLHLKIKSITVIGHSMGGYVSLALLEKHKSLINALCLMNSTAIADTKLKKNNRTRAIQAVKLNKNKFINLSIANLFRPKNRLLFKDAFNHVKKEALKTSLQSIIASLEGMKIRQDRLQIFKDSKIPKLVILGKKDIILDYKLQRSYYKNTDINVVEFPDGHMSYIENCEELSYKIMHFIENI